MVLIPVGSNAPMLEVAALQDLAEKGKANAAVASDTPFVFALYMCEHSPGMEVALACYVIHC